MTLKYKAWPQPVFGTLSYGALLTAPVPQHPRAFWSWNNIITPVVYHEDCCEQPIIIYELPTHVNIYCGFRMYFPYPPLDQCSLAKCTAQLVFASWQYTSTIHAPCGGGGGGGFLADICRPQPRIMHAARSRVRIISVKKHVASLPNIACSTMVSENWG